jgi:NAD+ diphosphatase
MSPRPDLGFWPHLGYAASRVERAAEKRTDADALRALENDAAARWYVVGGELVALRKTGSSHDPLFERAPAHALGAVTHTAFLGLMDGAPRFALAIEAAAMEALKSRDGFEVTDLRTIAVRGMVEDEHLPPLAEGKSLLLWHARRRFCSNCGAETRILDAGWRRDCPSCKMQHFPRTDPVVIMLVTDTDRVMLGRAPNWPPRRYSALAGFVEPGESLEEAVAREVAEESGVDVGRPRYVASQPWPFPASLMLGFEAPWRGGEPRAQEDEIQDVRWFSRAEVAAAAALDVDGWGGAPDAVPGDGLLLPPRLAIARRLLEHWLDR